MDWFTLGLSVALLLWGITTFVSNNVLHTVAGIAAIIAGAIGLARLL